MQSLETVASFGLFCSFLSWLVMAAVAKGQPAKGRPIFRLTRLQPTRSSTGIKPTPAAS